jgi:hypothetical protein
MYINATVTGMTNIDNCSDAVALVVVAVVVDLAQRS